MLKKDDGFTCTPKFGVILKGGGFTLIELLVVVGIIAVLASVVLSSTVNARNKGADAGVKSNLRNALSQAEVFYATNTVAMSTYTNVCTNGVVGGANGVGASILAAAKSYGLNSYGINDSPSASVSVATCNDSAGAWAAEVPLRNGSNQMWCVDSAGSVKQENNVSIGAGTVCS